MSDRKNKIIDILKKLAFFSEIKGDNFFKINAYNNAQKILSDLDVEKLYYNNELKNIKGIGKGIYHIIHEVIEKKEVEELLNIYQTLPESLYELKDIKGFGPKKIAILFKELNISSLSELEYAINENRLIAIKGFGEKSQSNILLSLKEKQKNQDLLRLDQALALFYEIKEQNHEAILVGKARRGEIVIDKLEILSSEKINIETSFTIITHKYPKNLLNICEFLLTGDEDFLKKIHSLAKNKNIKISFDGFIKDNNFIATKSEEEIFDLLNIYYIEPNMRDKNAVLVEKGKARPKIIELKDLQGTFHNHTLASDGINTLEEMRHKAIELGLSYISINDHSQSAFYAHGQKDQNILEQIAKIDLLNQDSLGKKCHLFSGTESDILADGSLDYGEEILKKLTVIIASIHSRLKQDEDAITLRVLNAIKNPYTTILGHPTGRLILGRKESLLNIGKVIEAAKKFAVVLELNANPHRLDLSVENLRLAKEAQVKISINPDAHSQSGLSDLHFGIMMAQKAHLGPEDVINSLSLTEIKNWLKKTREKRLTYA